MLVCRIVLLSVLSSVTARYTEDTGPYSSGVVGRWEGKGRRVSRGAAVAMALRCSLWPLYRWPPGRRRSKPRPPPCRRCSGSHGRRRVWLPRRTEAPLPARSSVPRPRRNRPLIATPIPRSSSPLPTVEHVSLQTLAHSLIYPIHTYQQPFCRTPSLRSGGMNQRRFAHVQGTVSRTCTTYDGPSCSSDDPCHLKGSYGRFEGDTDTDR